MRFFPVDELRRALESAVIGKKNIRDVRLNLNTLRDSYSNSILEIETDVNELTCLPSALGLHTSDDYLTIARSEPFPDAFAGARFGNFLLDGRLRELKYPKIGDLIFYTDVSRNFLHAGKMIRPDRVRSKWGLYPVFEHGICEVPESYGQFFCFFESVEQQEAIGLFLDYVGAEMALRN